MTDHDHIVLTMEVPIKVFTGTSMALGFHISDTDVTVRDPETDEKIGYIHQYIGGGTGLGYRDERAKISTLDLWGAFLEALDEAGFDVDEEDLPPGGEELDAREG